MKEKLKSTYMVVTLILLVVMTLRISSLQQEINHMERTLSYVNNEVSGLGSEIRGIHNEISNDLAEDNLVNEYDYDFNEATGMMEVEILFRNLETGAEVSLNYKETEAEDKDDFRRITEDGPAAVGVWQSVPLHHAGNAVYQGTFPANNLFDYELAVVAKGSTTMTDTIGSYRQYGKNMIFFEGDMRPRSYSTDGEIEYMADLDVFSDDDLDLKFESILCEMLVEEHVVDSFDLTDPSLEVNSFIDRHDAHFSYTRHLESIQGVNEHTDFDFRMTITLEDGRIYQAEWLDRW